MIKLTYISFLAILSISIFAKDINLYAFNHRFGCMIYPSINSEQDEFRVVRIEDYKIIYREKINSINHENYTLQWDLDEGFCILKNKYLPNLIETKFDKIKLSDTKRDKVSFNQVAQYLNYNRYDTNQLPVYDIELFKFFSDALFQNLVAKRSKEILTNGADFRIKGMRKPIHPMGIGFTGKIEFVKNPYSGIFKSKSLPVIGRLSISQGNPFKHSLEDSSLKQKRSTSLALKIFNTQDLNEKVVTANAVFQNDLNGEILNNYLDGVMTNQPVLDFKKIKQSYEWFTLLGVVHGSLNSPSDQSNLGLGINPQYRPLHQLSEVGEINPSMIKTPTWLKFQLAKEIKIVKKDDFREEISETLIENGQIIYDIFSGELDQNNREQWVKIGKLIINNTYLSKGVDENIIFHHSSLRSEMTGMIINPTHIVTPIKID